MLCEDFFTTSTCSKVPQKLQPIIRFLVVNGEVHETSVLNILLLPYHDSQRLVYYNEGVFNVFWLQGPLR